MGLLPLLLLLAVSGARAGAPYADTVPLSQTVTPAHPVWISPEFRNTEILADIPVPQAHQVNCGKVAELWLACVKAAVIQSGRVVPIEMLERDKVYCALALDRPLDRLKAGYRFRMGFADGPGRAQRLDAEREHLGARAAEAERESLVADPTHEPEPNWPHISEIRCRRPGRGPVRVGDLREAFGRKLQYESP